MRATENQGVGAAVGELGKVPMSHRTGHVAVGPADLGEGDEEWASNLRHRGGLGPDRHSARVGRTPNGAFGGKDGQSTRGTGLERSLHAGFHHTDHGNAEWFSEAPQRWQGMGGGCVAGHHDGLDPLGEQESGQLDGIPLDGLG